MLTYNIEDHESNNAWKIDLFSTVDFSVLLPHLFSTIKDFEER
jgi:hypothetical protein